METLKQLEAEFMQTAVEKGSQGYMSYYAEDAVEIPNGAPLIQGKSEISKSIAGVVLKGPVFVKDYFRDMEQVSEILKRDFSTIYRNRAPAERCCAASGRSTRPTSPSSNEFSARPSCGR